MVILIFYMPSYSKMILHKVETIIIYQPIAID